MKSLSRDNYMALLPLISYSYSSTDENVHHFHDRVTNLDLHRITNTFHEAFATGVACHQGTLTFPDTWFLPAFWTCVFLRLFLPNLPRFFSSFRLEYPSVLSRFSLEIDEMIFASPLAPLVCRQDHYRRPDE